MKRLLSAATYHVVYALWHLLSLLPLGVHYLFSDILYLLAYRLFRYRLRIVRKNMRDSFPGEGKAGLRRMERGFYHFFCDYLVETVKLKTISEKELKRRMVFRNTQQIDATVAAGQSCAVFLGHYCNWEWVTSLPLWVSPEAQCGQIYHPLENKGFDRLFLHLRQRFGAVCISMSETLRRIVEYQQAGKPVVIGYISDQVPFWNNIHHWTDFLHHDTPVLSGTERLARSTGHAVFYLDVHRVKRGYYEAEFKLITAEPKKMREFEITDVYFRMLEESIRRAPEFWLWSHNRWKRSHEEYNIRYDEKTDRVDLGDLEQIKREKGLI